MALNDGGASGKAQGAEGDRADINEQLAQSERRLRDVLDSVSDAYYAVDRDWRVTTFNAAAERYFGLSRDEVLGRGIWELFPQGKDAPFGALCRGAMNDGKASRLETVSALRPGRAVELRITPTAEGFCVALSDITERRDVERELRASEARYRERADELSAVLDAAPAAIWIARDNSAEIIDGNRFARELLRVAGDSNMSKSGADADATLQHFRVLDADGAEIAPDDLPVQRAARGELVLGFEERLAFADGSEAWLIGNAAPLRDSAGRPRGAVAAFADITAMKRVEHDLREREQMFRTLAETIGDVFYIADRAPRRLVYVSPAFARVWGHPVEWLVEDASRFRETLHPGDVADFIAAHDAWSRTAQMELTYRIVRPDGDVRWILDRAFPVPGDSGRFVGLAEDITERVQEERRRDLLLHELNHRVKNSLAVVQAMAMQSLQAPDRAHAAATFDARLQALASAHDALLQSQWEGGDLATIVRRAVSMQIDRPQRVQLDGPPLALNARTALALTLAMHELGTNAVKYGALSTPDGGVEVSWSTREGHLHLMWREFGGPPVKPPERKGFGVRLIERGLAHELQGRVTVDFLPGGVVCRVDAPLPEASSDLIGSPRGRDPTIDGAVS